MKPSILLSFFLPVFILSTGNNLAQMNQPVAAWNFDRMQYEEYASKDVRKGVPSPTIDRIFTVDNNITGEPSRIKGNYFRLVNGVSGKAILLDGLTGFMTCKNFSSFQNSGNFSACAWVALGAYPVNWCPVIDHSTITSSGYFMGIDAYGHAGFKLFSNGKLFEIRSQERIPLRKWTHIAAIYSASSGMNLYLNGQLVAATPVIGKYEPCLRSDLLIGRHSIKSRPEGTLNPKTTEEVYTFFDGLIDEVKIFDKSISADELVSYVKQTNPLSSPDIPPRKLPSGFPVNSEFGAVYSTLSYYEPWDALWRIGDHADITVHFDNNPVKFIFWRGTNYIPHWVTENGIWYNNEFLETWSTRGCHEPMSDKRCQFSYVRILENNDARVKVHWRYALIDNWNNLARVDTLTGWGEWADEVYTIYPDGVTVRAVTLRSPQPQSPHEWHESIIVMGPGTKPEDAIDPEAITLANMNGETYTYSWRNGIPPEADKSGFVHQPDKANIHLVNTRSEYKPFVILNPDSNPRFDIYNASLRRDVSIFPWWNHWPVSQIPSDGRYALDSDLASHSSLSHAYWDPYKLTHDSSTKLMLNGLTGLSAKELIPLARSWSYPAPLEINDSPGFADKGYDPAERAYHLTRISGEKSEILSLKIKATSGSPLVNPAFIIENWGKKDPVLFINKKEIAGGKDFRYGSRKNTTGTDLIIWLKLSSESPVSIKIKPR